jgi:FkbM family methyltransferase
VSAWTDISERWRGLRSNFLFSNRFEVLFNRIFRRNLPLSRYCWKGRLTFLCNSRLGEHISIQECFCARDYDHCLDHCHFASNRITYVNVGANIGAFDLLLVDRGLQVETGLAVEMNQATLERCLSNLRNNGMRSTSGLNAAIAHTNGSIRFQPTGLSISDSIFNSPENQEGGVQVESLTLETLTERHCRHFPRFDLLKLDCERAEYAIIRTTPLEVLGKFRHVIVEFHPEPPGESIDAAYARFAAGGFKPLRSAPGTPHFIELFVRPS